MKILKICNCRQDADRQSKFFMRAIREEREFGVRYRSWLDYPEEDRPYNKKKEMRYQKYKQWVNKLRANEDRTVKQNLKKFN